MTTATSQQSTIHLPVDMDIVQAAAMRNEFLKFLNQDADITLEGSETERVHAAGLQLLTSLLRGCRAVGQGWQWAQISPALREAVEGMGLADELQIPSNDSNAEMEKEAKESA